MATWTSRTTNHFYYNIIQNKSVLRFYHHGLCHWLLIWFYTVLLYSVVNYGAIGSILGHEMTHGFDIEGTYPVYCVISENKALGLVLIINRVVHWLFWLGKNYDFNGKKTMWWSQKIIQEYVKRAQCFIKEYDQYMLTKNVYVRTYRQQYS